MLKQSKKSDGETSVSKRRDDQFAEAITGWATSLFFPLPTFPNRYARLPWRRVFKARGSIRGALFIARVLALWPFELALEIFYPKRGTYFAGKVRQDDTSQFDHGDHICHLYQSEDSLLRVLSPFIAVGLKKGERCFCVQKPLVKERLCSALSSMGVDVEHEIGRGALIFQSEEELYFDGGGFDPKTLIDRLGKLIANSLKEGYSGLRTAGEMSRVSNDPVLWKQILEYENAVDEFYADKKAIAFCCYRLSVTPTSIRSYVLDAHSLHVVDHYGMGAA